MGMDLGGPTSVRAAPASLKATGMVGAVGVRRGGAAYGSGMSAPRALDVPSRRASVLRPADPQLPVGELGGGIDDLREAHDGDDVLHGDVAPVDLLEEVDHLL